MLLRLGRADLAESLYAAATTWTPETARPDLTDEHLRFPALARPWTGTVYSRLIGAHFGGDDALALDAARRLDRFRKAVEAKARALGLPPDTRQARTSQIRPTRNPNVVTELLADQERRAREAPRGPRSRRAAATRPRGSRP